MTESPDCILVWFFLVLTIVLFVGGCAGCCCVAWEDRGDKRQGGDVEMQRNARDGADDLPPPPPTKRWSIDERKALSRAFLRLPPSCLPDVKAIVGSDEPTVDFASLDVSVCDRLQQYVDAQPSRDCLAGKTHEICVLSGMALVCVVPAFCVFLYFAHHCVWNT